MCYCCVSVSVFSWFRWGPNAVLTACIRRHIEKQGGKLDANPLVRITWSYYYCLSLDLPFFFWPCYSGLCCHIYLYIYLSSYTFSALTLLVAGRLGILLPVKALCPWILNYFDAVGWMRGRGPHQTILADNCFNRKPRLNALHYNDDDDDDDYDDIAVSGWLLRDAGVVLMFQNDVLPIFFVECCSQLLYWYKICTNLCCSETTAYWPHCW